MASVDKLLWKLLSKEEVKCLILSASFVWVVLIFGNPFGLVLHDEGFLVLHDEGFLVTELSCSEQENDQCCNQHCDNFE